MKWKKQLTSTISLFSSFPILYLKHESGLGVNFSSNGCPITATKTWNIVGNALLKIPCLGLMYYFILRNLPPFHTEKPPSLYLHHLQGHRDTSRSHYHKTVGFSWTAWWDVQSAPRPLPSCLWPSEHYSWYH